jgi:hypothetical protein
MKRGAVAVVVSAAAAAVLPLPPNAVERWYSTLVYPAIQRVLTPASNLVPFALFDVLCVTAVCAFAVTAYRCIRRFGWRTGVLRLAGRTLVAAATIYLAFLATWGLNYRRVPIVDKVAFDPARVNRAAAGELGDMNAATLNRLYAAAQRGAFSTEALGASFQQTVREMGARMPVAPGRPKETLLGGYFHQVAVSGMTDPLSLETLVAPDLLDVERPFVIAHEWAHLAGYADESEANFIAWLTCRHGDAAAQYSASLIMIGYARPGHADALDIGPAIDLLSLQERYKNTSEVLRSAARQGYDTYLKANRVKKGVESYDAVVQLILGTRMDDDGYPRRR